MANVPHPRREENTFI